MVERRPPKANVVGPIPTQPVVYRLQAVEIFLHLTD